MSKEFVRSFYPGPEHADFIMIILNLLLSKLGGQIVIPISDIAQCSHDYAGTRFARIDDGATLVLTLKTRENYGG